MTADKRSAYNIFFIRWNVNVQMVLLCLFACILKFYILGITPYLTIIMVRLIGVMNIL